LVQWNINGWSANTRDTKKLILQTFDADVISLCETHLSGNDEIDLDNYKCFVHNRQYRHCNLNRTFGGVQVLVKYHVLNCYDVTVTDKSYDGILCLRFVNKMSGYCFFILSCYLPPSNSIWGRDGVAFYNHLLSLLYSYSDADALYIMGDLNSRFGNESETIDYVDCTLPERKIIDKNKNKHGELLLDFLKDGQLCIVNGRVNNELDNFTYVESSRGCSVVDFVIVPHINLANIEHFQVHTPLDLMHSVHECDKYISDHSVLEFVLSPHYSQGDLLPERNEADTVVVENENENVHKNR
jgi:exonuclease III